MLAEKCLLEHNRETNVGLSESVNKNCDHRPQRIYHHGVISGCQENVIILETVRDRNTVTIEH